MMNFSFKLRITCYKIVGAARAATWFLKRQSFFCLKIKLLRKKGTGGKMLPKKSRFWSMCRLRRKVENKTSRLYPPVRGVGVKTANFS
jgi:hypothetical protein